MKLYMKTKKNNLNLRLIVYLTFGNVGNPISMSCS